MRYNLDPFGERGDSELAGALRKAHLAADILDVEVRHRRRTTITNISMN